MDISIVAALGSFGISEKVLRPKATILVILASVLCYDLTTKTHDPSSSRVYCGPILCAFTILCTAISLRTWRRNGVACDELLFLPGSEHEILANNPTNNDIESSVIPTQQTPPASKSHIHIISEGDAAGGLALQPVRRSPVLIFPDETLTEAENSFTDDVPRPSASPLSLSTGSFRSESSSLGARRIIDDDNRNCNGDSDLDIWEGDGEDSTSANSEEDGKSGIGKVENKNSRADLETRTQRRSIHTTVETNAREENNVGSSAGTADDEHVRLTEFQIFRENHPRITRLGTFFFFRSAPAPETTAYAPSGPMVFGAALDLTVPIMFNFHLFIQQYNHISATGGSDTAAKILIIIFLSILIVRCFLPPQRRGRFWSTIKFTAMAPFHSINFRDAFVGDVLTSLVRPIQDILFALTYYGTVIYGTLFGHFGLAEAGDTLEQSWVLHNILLPSFALLPLWWKFLQTLRQSYESGKRWPYLGDAFKYLSAALVVLYGMTHPAKRTSALWIITFIIAALYQIWWDTMMDWKLFVILPRNETTQPQCELSCFTISSLRPSSRLLLIIQKYVIQPVENTFRLIGQVIPNLDQIQLRPHRLYKRKSFYWAIFFFNFFFRFTWMLCFIPPPKVSSDEHLIFSSDVSSYIGVLLPIAEITRRCLWGFLKVETETLRLMEVDSLYTIVESGCNDDCGEDSEGLLSGTFSQCVPAWMDIQRKQQHSAALSSSRWKLAQYLECSESFLDKLFLVELSLWVFAFVAFGYATVYS